jgi:Domain of unknown function (DUF1707)
MATGPDLRIGDAEREAAAAGLREHYAQGRLTLEEFNQRIDAVFQATTQRQLDLITRDLPHVASPSAALPVAAVAGDRERDRQDDWSGWQARRPRARLGVFPTIIAALAVWLLLFDLHLRMFPWPGKLALLLAALAAVRAVMRRIFGLRGGRVHRGCGRSRARRF